MASHVLVLGAGASVHYTFPLARELVRRVVKGSDMPRPTRMEQLGFELNTYDSFVRRLRMSGATSVDQFAAYLDDPADIHMAKALIAYYLACCEQRDDLTAPDRTDHWYELLANHLIGRTLDSFPQRDIAIITFNYERSLERYLHDCLLTRFITRQGTDEIRKAFFRLPIIHIYGHLGRLPGFGGIDESEREYQPVRDKTQLELAIAGMHLLPELNRDQGLGDRDAARTCVRDATGDITFLGFAYAQENLEALDLTNTRTNKRLHGTIVGFDEGEPFNELNARLGGFGGPSFSNAWRSSVYEVVRMHPTTILGKPRQSDG
jgi:hypothetical protein